MASTTFNNIINGIEGGFNSMVEFVKMIIDKIIKFFEPVTQMFDKVSNFKMPSLSELNPFSGDEKEKNADALSSVETGFKVAVGAYNLYKKNEEAVLDFFANAKNMIAGLVGNNATTNTNTQNNNIKIEIKTDNPKMAGQQVLSELQGVLNNANLQFNTGGR
jgi:hypothetical protein